MNQNEDDKAINHSMLAEILDQFSTGVNVLDNSTIRLNDDFDAPGKTTSVWELRK